MRILLEDSARLLALFYSIASAESCSISWVNVRFDIIVNYDLRE